MSTEPAKKRRTTIKVLDFGLPVPAPAVRAPIFYATGDWRYDANSLVVVNAGAGPRAAAD